jgi:hypothetical protein
MRRHLLNTNRSWRLNETYVRVAGKWTYLYRALDSAGNTVDFLLSPHRDRGQPSTSYNLPWGGCDIFGRASSTWMDIPPTRPSLPNGNKPANCRNPVAADLVT